jgi:hypothetical protein
MMTQSKSRVDLLALLIALLIGCVIGVSGRRDAQ